MIRREFRADRINAVLNHPEVLPWVTLPGLDALDLSELVEDRRNILLMTEEGDGGVLFHRRSQGVFEAHSQYLPSARGKRALAATREAVDWMFRNTDCRAITTMVPADNRPAEALAVRCGLKLYDEVPHAWPRQGRMVAARYFALSRAQWKDLKTCQLQQQ